MLVHLVQDDAPEASSPRCSDFSQASRNSLDLWRRFLAPPDVAKNQPRPTGERSCAESLFKRFKCTVTANLGTAISAIRRELPPTVSHSRGSLQGLHSIHFGYFQSRYRVVVEGRMRRKNTVHHSRNSRSSASLAVSCAFQRYLHEI